MCGATVRQLEELEWFLKGPDSWRKPVFGEKSFLRLAFFNLWHCLITNISSVEYLWFNFLLFVDTTTSFLFFFLISLVLVPFFREVYVIYLSVGYSPNCNQSCVSNFVNDTDCDLAATPQRDTHTCWYRHLAMDISVNSSSCDLQKL